MRSWESKYNYYYWTSGLTLFFNSCRDSIRLSQVLHRNLLWNEKVKSVSIFDIICHTSLLRLLIIFGDEAFLWKISVADALIFIWRRIPAYSKDKCLWKFRLKLLVISRIVKEILYSNDSYMISKRTFIQFQDTDFLLLQSKIISIHIRWMKCKM